MLGLRHPGDFLDPTVGLLDAIFPVSMASIAGLAEVNDGQLGENMGDTSPDVYKQKSKQPFNRGSVSRLHIRLIRPTRAFWLFRTYCGISLSLLFEFRVQLSTHKDNDARYPYPGHEADDRAK